MADKQTVQTLCRICNDHCAINVHMEHGRIVAVDGYADHPWNRGRVCLKARVAADLIYHPQRILKPLKRTASGWQEIGLEIALDEIGERLRTVIDRYEAHAVGIWNEESIGIGQSEPLARRFLQAIGSLNYFNSGLQRYESRQQGYRLVLGAWPIPDYENARCIIVWGANPTESHPSMVRPIMTARRHGATLIVIDPRHSTIARKADWHVQLYPGTDGAFAWGIIHQLVTNQWYDKKFVKEYTLGFEAIAAYSERFTVDAVEKETGVPSLIVREVARAMASAAPATAIYLGSGPTCYENSINDVRAVACLESLLGSIDRRGGNRLVVPFEGHDLTHNSIGQNRFSGTDPLQSKYQAESSDKKMMKGNSSLLKALFLTGTNPALTFPNSEKVRHMLASMDLVVVRDLFLTETTKFAHYFLPAATFLECSELYSHASYQIINLAPMILCLEGVQTDYSFWKNLAVRLGYEDSFPWRDEREYIRWCLESAGIELENLKIHPEGISYKPVCYEKWRKRPFATPSGKVEFALSHVEETGYSELPEYHSSNHFKKLDPDYPFILVRGERHGRFHEIVPCFCNLGQHADVEMNPKDAVNLGINGGELVRISSQMMSVASPVRVIVCDEVLSGVVQINCDYKNIDLDRLFHAENSNSGVDSIFQKPVLIRIEKA